MTPKTERFEMRLDPALLEQVDAWRSRQSDLPSRAEAIRRLAENGMAGPERRDFRPTGPEKLIIWLLTEVLRTQKSHDDPKTIKFIQEVMQGGHFWALDWELPGVLHDHVDSRSTLTLVLDALDMWVFIERAHQGFSTTEKKRIATEVGPLGENPRFIGFDGNTETEHMSVARFLVENMGRFTAMKGRDFNSHVPLVKRYREMTALFDPMRATLLGRELSVDEVITLLKR